MRTFQKELCQGQGFGPWHTTGFPSPARCGPQASPSPQRKPSQERCEGGDASEGFQVGGPAQACCVLPEGGSAHSRVEPPRSLVVRPLRDSWGPKVRSGTGSVRGLSADPHFVPRPLSSPMTFSRSLPVMTRHSGTLGKAAGEWGPTVLLASSQTSHCLPGPSKFPFPHPEEGNWPPWGSWRSQKADGTWQAQGPELRPQNGVDQVVPTPESS